MHVESKPFEAETYRAEVGASRAESSVPELERIRQTVRWRRSGAVSETGEQEVRAHTCAVQRRAGTPVLNRTARHRGGTRQLGRPQKESNARIVRWSNGSMSLMIGKHYFQVSETDMVGDRTVRWRWVLAFVLAPEQAAWNRG